MDTFIFLIVGAIIFALIGRYVASQKGRSESEGLIIGGKLMDEELKFSLMSLFEEQKNKAQTLKAEIYKTDKEIDQMVYELYGLTKEEIEIVENS
jgi:hypothetical protein